MPNNSELLRSIEALGDKLDDQNEKAKDVEGRLNTHLAVCESQNREILARFARQDRILWAILTSVVGALALIAWDLIKDRLIH
jgi:hypothetical protein